MIALLLFLFLKFFVADVVRVSSPDMLDTFSEGSSLLLNRLAGKYKHGDVICFKFPGADGKGGDNCIQRVIALPGDTLEIRDKHIFVNGSETEENETFRFNYFLRFNSPPDSSFFKKYKLFEGGAVSGNNDFSYTMTRAQADSVRRDSLIHTLEIKIEKLHVYNETIFPWSPSFAWNPDNYGKLYVPAKGDTLLLDSLNIELYELIITVFEKNKLFKQGDSIYINDQYQNKYVIKDDYFFVMGDNRDNAVDSRHFGFLPKKFIRGKIAGTINRVN